MRTPYDKTQRQWQNPHGYQYLAVWKNAAILRLLIRAFTKTLPKNEFRLKTQLDDAVRSFKSNIEEGFKRPTTKEYLDYLGFSQGSLEEIRGNIEDCLGDGFLGSTPGNNLEKLGIKLLRASDKRSFKGNVREFEAVINKIDPKDISHEAFTELINKTDYLLRKQVEALRVKLAKEQESLKLKIMRNFHQQW